MFERLVLSDDLKSEVMRKAEEIRVRLEDNLIICEDTLRNCPDKYIPFWEEQLTFTAHILNDYYPEVDVSPYL